MVPHILLEEIGAPFERVLVDRMAVRTRRRSTSSSIRTACSRCWSDGGHVHVREPRPSAAPVRHPPAGRPGPRWEAEAAHFYQWLAWLTEHAAVQPAAVFLSRRWMNEGNAAGVAELRAHAERRIGVLVDMLETELARHGQPWFGGAQYSALDPYVFTLCRWTRNFKASPPARERKLLGPYLQRVLARPAVQRVFAAEQLAAPFV
jgi:glutathione S-transferase